MGARHPRPRSSRSGLLGMAVGAVVLSGCVAGEAARSVCSVELGDASLRVLENDDTITVADAASENGVDDGLVFDKSDAVVITRRADAGVDVLALGTAEEASGTWSSLEPDGDCRLEDGPALRVGTYTDGPAELDLDGTIVELPPPDEVPTEILVPITATR